MLSHVESHTTRFVTYGNVAMLREHLETLGGDLDAWKRYACSLNDIVVRSERLLLLP